jgi:hypothetical protein
VLANRGEDLRGFGRLEPVRVVRRSEALIGQVDQLRLVGGPLFDAGALIPTSVDGLVLLAMHDVRVD